MEALTLGPLAIPLSRLFLLLGLLVVFASAYWWERRRKIDLSTPLWAALLIGLVTARALYVLVHWQAFSSDPLTALYLWQDGYAPVAGVLAALVFAGLYAYRQGYPLRILQIPLLAGTAVWFGLTLLMGILSAQHELPDIVLTDLSERPAPLQQFSGQSVVVNLWASWCPPCRREMPVLQAAQQQHEGIHFVFINQREPLPTVTDYLAAAELELENVLLDPAGAVADHFGAHGMPTTLFFDTEGRLVDSHLGEVSAARLQQYLRALQ